MTDLETRLQADATSRFRIGRRLLQAAAIVAISLAPVFALASVSGSDDGGTHVAEAPGSPPVTVHELELITGDQVTLEVFADGRVAASVVPAGRDGYAPSFETIQADGQVYVIPSDAAALVPGLLDRELFNVTRLAEYGYTSESGLPVIAVYGDASTPSAGETPALSAMAHAEPGAMLESINAHALRLDPDFGTFWNAARPAIAPDNLRQRARAGEPLVTEGPLTGVEKIWLDQQVSMALDVSGPLIGAPAAHAAGLDGTGVTVAVLDTGVDTSHPDLEGAVVAAENFTDSDTVEDVQGHGTHVAGIIAGSAAVSDGEFLGIAPGTGIMNGKVLGDTGSGAFSQVIEGMEWAVAEGADIVNLSLGTQAPSDGNDPVSQAADQLTASDSVLFVSAAGNRGNAGDSTVTGPGAASLGLGVGSISKTTGSVASSSGRGPRLGDAAVKPDLTAPGVSIVSLLAIDSDFGFTVDDFHTRATGTSQAAPHVAGAAAILLQQQPTLTPEQLKALLVTSAVPSDDEDEDVFVQGGGRVDIPRLLVAPVVTTPAPLDLGLFEFPHDDIPPMQADVTYTNLTEDTVTLTLSLDVSSRNGDVPGEDMLSFEPDTMEIEEGATATSTISLDVGEGEEGLYGGYLIAEDDDGIVLRTPLGFHKEPERMDLTVEGIARDGRPAGDPSSFDVINAVDASVYAETSMPWFEDGLRTIRVPPGTYAVMGVIRTLDEDNEETLDWTMASVPEIEVFEDTTVVLDAREGNPVVYETPAHPTKALDRTTVLHWRESEELGSFSHGYTSAVPTPTFAVATEPVTLGDFEFHTRQRLGAPDADSSAESPYLYDLVVPYQGHVPEDLTFFASPDSLVTLVNDIHHDLPEDQERGELRHYWRPWQFASSQLLDTVDAPHRRVELLVPGDTRYRQGMRADPPFVGRMSETAMVYEAGETRHQSWFRSPSRPAINDGGPLESGTPVIRTGDTLDLLIPEWTGAQPQHWGFMHGSVDDSAFRLYENGELIAETARANGEFDLSPEDVELRLELDVSRDAPWWLTSTATSTAWTVQADRPADDDELHLPILEVEYDLAVDRTNVALPPNENPGPPTIGVRASHQQGAADAEIAEIRVWASDDDGATWWELNAFQSQRPFRQQNGDWKRFLLTGPPFGGNPDGLISLRVEARDVNGNSIEQDIMRAYRLP